MSVHAVVVTYRPELPTLRALLDALQAQVDAIWLLDNGSDEVREIAAALPANARLVANGDNLGLSAAYNRGVALARAAGAREVLLFDQDSVPDADMVAVLRDALQRLAMNARVAAVGPIYSDIKGGRGYFVRKRGLGLARVDAGDGAEVPVDHLISSGCLFPVEVFDVVGGFAEELFIDYVDTEWCLRARSKGFALYGIAAAHMRHDLGERFLHLFGKRIPLHAPLRNRYLFRNGVWLWARPWVGWQWRAIDALRLSKIFLALLLFAPNRGPNLRAIACGLADALRGRMGRIG